MGFLFSVQERCNYEVLHSFVEHRGQVIFAALRVTKITEEQKCKGNLDTFPNNTAELILQRRPTFQLS